MNDKQKQIEEMAEIMCDDFGASFFAEKLYDAGYRKQSDTVRGLMKDSIILLVKECIAAHACVQTENGNVVGYFLDDLAIDRIANDVAEAMEVEE